MYFSGWLSAVFTLTVLTSGCAPSDPATVAETIYFGGPIVTMNDAQLNAEALAVKDGKILAVGSRAEIDKLHKGKSTRLVDLDGKTLMPGFIDGHAHVGGFGSQAVGANLLAEPDGTANTIDDLVAKLQAFAKSPDVERTGWIFGLGYDDSLLGRHPTREDLDKVSPTIPVIAVHISAHMSAMNSAGLKAVGIGPDSEDPPGGVIRREADGKTPNGVLEELASIPYMVKAINPTKAADQDFFLAKGIELAKSYGYTTATEGRLLGPQDAAMRGAASRGLMDIDVIGWADYTVKSDLDTGLSPDYSNHYRLGGLKINLDGSPQGRTAWSTKAYLIPPDGQKAGYKGYPAIEDTAKVQALLDEAYTKGWPVKVHANGDAAIDQLFAALRPVVAKHGVKPGQTILIHGQFLRSDQVQDLKSLGIFPSMFPMHTFYWGDWYKQIIGPERAAKISPMRSILNTGLHATSHTDAPVALPNLMQVVWATVNRISRSGEIIGADERVTPLEAMKMITLWGAEQFGEDKTKGSLAPGKLADMVVLSDNPLTIEPTKINAIVVLETIKEGKTVYARAQ
jgi:hypothetical protein